MAIIHRPVLRPVSKWLIIGVQFSRQKKTVDNGLQPTYFRHYILQITICRMNNERKQCSFYIWGSFRKKSPVPHQRKLPSFRLWSFPEIKCKNWRADASFFIVTSFRYFIVINYRRMCGLICMYFVSLIHTNHEFIQFQ